MFDTPVNIFRELTDDTAVMPHKWQPENPIQAKKIVKIITVNSPGTECIFSCWI